MCSFIPAGVGESSEDQIDTKKGIDRAIDESIGAEFSKGSLDEKRDRSSWAGADAEIDKERPESILSNREGILANAVRKFFAECERDEHGYCLPEGSSGAGVSISGLEGVHVTEWRKAVKLAKAKVTNTPKPTDEEIKAANEKMNLLGADKYESQIRGNTKDRANSRLRLLSEFGDGKNCPCIYCGLKLDESTVTRDKIYTAREGGRYHNDNLVPACIACNKSRGDVPF